MAKAKISMGNLSTSADTSRKLVKIDYEFLEIHENVRTEYNQETLQELADSIHRDGLENPIIIYKSDIESLTFFILDGHRRYKAIGLLRDQNKWSGGIQCLYGKAVLDPYVVMMKQTIINEQRDGLSPKDIRNIIVKCVKHLGSDKKAAEALSKSLNWVQMAMRADAVSQLSSEVDSLPIDVQASIYTIPDEKKEQVINEFKTGEKSRKEQRTIVKKIKDDLKPKKAGKPPEPKHIQKTKNYIKELKKLDTDKYKDVIKILSEYTVARNKEIKDTK